MKDSEAQQELLKYDEDSMENRFSILYLSKQMLEKSSSTLKNFSSFDQLEGKNDFLSKNKIKFDARNHKGLTNRLKNNQFAMKLYNKFYTKKRKEKLEQAIETYKKWDYRGSRMPRVRIRSKERILQSIQKKTESNGNSNRREIEKKITIENNMKKKLERLNRLKKMKLMELSWLYIERDYEAILNSREGATFTLEELSKDNYGWLIGGFNEQSLSKIWKFNLKTNHFKEVKVENIPGTIPRFNHSAVIYNRKIFIYGGEMINKIDNYTRSALGDIKIFDTSNLHF